MLLARIPSFRSKDKICNCREITGRDKEQLMKVRTDLLHAIDNITKQSQFVELIIMYIVV
jgi:hypothetical protein